MDWSVYERNSQIHTEVEHPCFSFYIIYIKTQYCACLYGISMRITINSFVTLVVRMPKSPSATCSENTIVTSWCLGSTELLNLLDLLWMKPHMVPKLVMWQKQDWLLFGPEISLSLFGFYIFLTCKNGLYLISELFLTCNCSLQYGASNEHGYGWLVTECTCCWQWQWFNLRFSLLTL